MSAIELPHLRIRFIRGFNYIEHQQDETMKNSILAKQGTPGRQLQIIGIVVLLITLFLSARNLYADGLNECLVEALKYADDSVTVGELRKQCQEETGTISRTKPQDSPAVEIGSKGPAEMVLKTAQARKPAYFPHRIHQKKYPCGTCHHGQAPSGGIQKYNEKTVIYKCTACHNADMPNENLNGFQLIGHKLCRECHRKNQDITSARCSTCHRKNL